MTWLQNAKLSTKLITAFGLCALITLGVGLLGSRGVTDLSESLKLVFSNNLVSVAKTAEAKSKAIAQHRDLYALTVATAAGESQDLKDRIIRRMELNLADSEKAFAIYRSTPLADDERAAGDRMERDWPIYQSQVQTVLSLLKAGDVSAARPLLSGELQEDYTKVMDELTIMVESNNRQIEEGARDADQQERFAINVLYVGIALAFIAALSLGLIVSSLISRPIAIAVASARLIANGDLTESVSSSRRDETGQLLNALGDMQDSLKALFTKLPMRLTNWHPQPKSLMQLLKMAAVA